MTALMGSSGAGKTLLVNLIVELKAGGTISGKIFLNSHEAEELDIYRVTGYCEQMVHSSAKTAKSRRTTFSILFGEYLDMLGLPRISENNVGGSSVEELKRPSIVVELATQPSLLLLDEPTSEMDARVAKIVADGLRRVVDTGRTIVYTIQLPSAEVFRVLDNLVVLKRGGEMLYFGEPERDCTHLISYCASIPGTPPLQDDANPASWMLECIGADDQANDKGSAELDLRTLCGKSR